MNYLVEILVTKSGGDSKDIIVVPSAFGDMEPNITVEIGEEQYALGGLTKNASASKFNGGWVIYETAKGTAIVLLSEGSVFVNLFEHEEFILMEGNVLFYSDIGFSYFDKNGGVRCVFNDLNEYFTDIDYLNIDKGLVLFTRGDGSQKRLSVLELVTLIGKAIPPNLK